MSAKFDDYVFFVIANEVRQRFGDQVRQEVYGDMVKATFYEAVSKEKYAAWVQEKKLASAAALAEALGYECVGGENSPYIWIYGQTDSWAFFDLLLEKAGVVCTPGAGFGRCGEGFIRLSAFNDADNVQLAMQRIKQALS